MIVIDSSVALGLLPSVAIHKRPRLSTAQLSGMPNQPASLVAALKVAPTAATEGSPQRKRTLQPKLSAAWSPSGGSISTTWPKRFSGQGPSFLIQ